jgi:hypothetical protein
MTDMEKRVQNSGVARATPVFIGLAVVYAVLAIVANLVFSGNALVQTLLISLGSGVLGSGIAYFLIRLEQARNLSIVGMFIALAFVFITLILLVLLLFASNVFVYTLLLTTGAAIFTGGLTFFVVKLA